MKLLQDQSVKELVSDEFHSKILISAYSRLNDLNDPFRCNLFALLIREVIRLAVTKIAPDEEIKKTSWFSGDDGKVTRRCRYRFVCTGFLSDQILKDHQELNQEDSISALVKLSKDLSKYAHLSEKTYNLKVEEVLEFQNKVEEAVLAFSHAVISCRKELARITYEIAKEEMYDEFRTFLPNELKKLSHETLISGVNINELGYFDTSIEVPALTGWGTVDVSLTDWDRDGTPYGGNEEYAFSFEVLIDPETFSLEVGDAEFDIFHDDGK